MKNLFLSEWERLWSRKSLWLCFMAIPLILYVSAKYYLGINLKTPVTSPEFTSFGNFPNAAMQEQLILAFNLIVVFISVLIITEEYRSGELRMVMIRPVKFNHIFIAKFLVLVAIISLYMVTYFLASIGFGYFLFPKVDQIAVFYHQSTFSIGACLLYAVKYYLLSLITLIAIGSVAFFIAIISKSVVVAVGVNLAFILFSAGYPTVLQVLNRGGGLSLYKLQLLSITHIQHMGIAAMLAEKPLLIGFTSLVLTSYILIFSILSYVTVSKKDHVL